jgi:hypothetical protein
MNGPQKKDYECYAVRIEQKDRAAAYIINNEDLPKIDFFLL